MHNILADQLEWLLHNHYNLLCKYGKLNLLDKCTSQYIFYCLNLINFVLGYKVLCPFSKWEILMQMHIKIVMKSVRGISGYFTWIIGGSTHGGLILKESHTKISAIWHDLPKTRIGRLQLKTQMLWQLCGEVCTASAHVALDFSYCYTKFLTYTYIKFTHFKNKLWHLKRIVHAVVNWFSGNM